MRLLALLGYGLAIWVAFAASEQEDSLSREKRQLPTPIQLGAGTSFGILALWSLVTLRLLSMAARFNNVNTTPRPFLVHPQPQIQLQPQPQIQLQPQPQIQPQPVVFRHQPQQHQPQRPQRPIIVQLNSAPNPQDQKVFVPHTPPHSHVQPQPLPAQQQPLVIRFNLNGQPETTTPRAGYLNPNVRRRRQEPRPLPPQVDVDKMLELIRKLDKANCIPLLVCQLYANQKPESYGLFERSVIKFVETYDGPAVQAGAAGAILKAAARLGKTDKSETKCAKAFPACPISAAQMRQVFKSTDAGGA